MPDDFFGVPDEAVEFAIGAGVVRGKTKHPRSDLELPPYDRAELGGTLRN